ncbi:uncharacterized protein NPIL_456941 [Nephila pilipes]|uniref:Uncharacterized protein n=1 Tax=Nephila pilipes TaxID=299642 RepID=A0A8X6R1C3_NEPPI|nr:uncharacterized protein NPIL_456941 [Nephila pilipes]
MPHEDSAAAINIASVQLKYGDMLQPNGGPIHSSRDYDRDHKTSLRYVCRLCSQYADSEEQRLRELIFGMQLGDHKPSHLLREMKSMAGNRIMKELLKSSLLYRLNTHVQQIFAISNDPLEKLADMTDGIMAAADHTSTINAENQDLKTMLMDISSRLSHLEKHERSTSFGPDRGFLRQ